MTARRATLLILGIPLLVLLLSVPACDLLVKVFGPPSVALDEAYDRAGTATFDHSRLGAVLTRFATEDGLVDYAGLARDPGDLDAYVTALASAPWEQLGRDDRLALLVNAYNAFTLRLMLDHWPVASIRDIPAARRWNAERWRVGPLTLSLEAIEHEYLRKNFTEPRIHFAINCASIGCPPLRREVYTGARIEEQLQDQARFVHRNGSRWFRLEQDTLHLTQLYRWFASDFVQVAGSTLDFAARFSPELAARLKEGARPGVSWLDYDWSINAKR